MSPLERSKARLEARGDTAEKTEHWNQFARRRHDLFNMFDLLAITDTAILGVQVTDGDHRAEHRDKLSANADLFRWLRVGGLVEIHAWRKVGARGKRKLWEVAIDKAVLIDGCAVQWVCVI